MQEAGDDDELRRTTWYHSVGHTHSPTQPACNAAINSVISKDRRLVSSSHDNWPMPPTSPAVSTHRTDRRTGRWICSLLHVQLMYMTHSSAHDKSSSAISNIHVFFVLAYVSLFFQVSQVTQHAMSVIRNKEWSNTGWQFSLVVTHWSRST